MVDGEKFRVLIVDDVAETREMCESCYSLSQI